MLLAEVAEVGHAETQGGGARDQFARVVGDIAGGAPLIGEEVAGTRNRMKMASLGHI